jgi:Domain of unknown function (DUF1905)
VGASDAYGPSLGQPKGAGIAVAYKFSGELWQYDGEAPWYFVTLPVEVSDNLRAEHGPAATAFGSVKVSVTVGATRWATSLFPDKSRGSYLLPVKKSVRTAEGLEIGSMVEVQIEPR